MKIARSVAGLFACCLVAACGGHGGTPSNLSNTPPPPPGPTNLSMQFFGTGANGIDRVKIPLLDANTVSRPINIGATAYTVEFWIKGLLSLNTTPACTAGPLAKDAWLGGTLVMDRDVLGDGDFGEFAVSLLGGQVAFAVSRDGGGQTLCGSSNVLDGNWHHVALTRELQTGQMTIFVDGAQDVSQGNPGSAQNIAYNPAHPNPDPNDPFLVLGAQKRDDTAARAFNGLIDELRISTMLRYTGTFPRPTAAFTLDGNTAALYHFDETAGIDVLDANANASPGVLVPAASGPASHRSTDVPF